MHKFICTILIILMTPFTVLADHRGGLNAAPVAVQYIMADPPLPPILNEQTKHHSLAKPGYLGGKFEGDYDVQLETGKISGPTLGATYSYNINNKWGFYSWLVGTKLKGDFSTKELSDGTTNSFARDVKVDFYNLSFGMTYKLYQSENQNFVSLFGGLYIPIYKFEERYVNERVGRQVDANITSDGTFYGMLVGIQWKKILNPKWAIGSFFVMADTFGSKAFMNPFGDSGECKSFKTTLNSGSSNNVPDGDQECSGGTSQEFLYDTQIGGIGVNVNYIPWDLTINLFSPFINRYILETFYDDVKPKFYYLTFSWGFSS